MTTTELILKAVNQLANTVKLTLGAKGRTVLYNTEENKPHITKDGVSVARHVSSNDSYEAMVMTVLKEAAVKTMLSSGDGTTTTMILAQYLINKGFDLLAEGYSFYQLAKEFDKALNDIITTIKTKYTKSIESNTELLKEVASISANDEKIGEFIYDIIKEIGIYGDIEVKTSPRNETVVVKTAGMKLHRGWLEGFMVNDAKEMVYRATNVNILILNDEIHALSDIEYYLKACLGSNLLIFCNDMSTMATKALKQYLELSRASVCVVENDGFGDRKIALMNDLAALTGAWVVDNGTAKDVNNLGFAGEVIVEELYTSILDGRQDTELVEQIIEEIKYKLQEDADNDELSLSNMERKWLRKRLANLTGGVAVIYAGGRTELEMKEIKDRLDDAVLAVYSAIKEGVCVGGGYTFINVKNDLYSPSNNKAYNTVLDAIEEPFKQLLINSDLINHYEEYRSKISKGQALDLRNNKLEKINNYKVYDPCSVLCDSLINAIAVAKSLLSVKQLVYDGICYKG
jgi:chaperonin GroEL